MIEHQIHISTVISMQRLDAPFFDGDIIKGKYMPLSKYVEIKGGKRIPKGESFSQTPTNYLYLRLTDIEDFNNLDYTKLPYLSEEVYQKLKRYEIKEGEKSRTQFFKGVVIQLRGTGATKTFTIRKMSGDVGVERVFPINMPALQKIEVEKRGKVRRARIYYFRSLRGKKARIKGRSF